MDLNETKDEVVTKLHEDITWYLFQRYSTHVFKFRIFKQLGVFIV